MKEKKILPVVIVSAAICIICAFVIRGLYRSVHTRKDKILVGMICDGDEGTLYSQNFYQALSSIQAEYGDRVKCDIRSNITADKCEDIITELIDEGADLIITNSYGYGESAKKMAGKYPKVQFVQATQENANESPVFSSYHTFMGRIYEGRYIAGQVAGRKLASLISTGVITKDQAVVGYVGAYPNAEVISGFTAFYLGVKDQCPSAVMKVRYTDTWTSYQKEYDVARQLIDEGCVIISQHSDTTGPAVACADADRSSTVFHVGYNQSSISIAPNTSLIATKIEWTPYLKAAVKAVLYDKKIEDVVKADIHGQDAGAGFDEGWVRMLTLNKAIAADGTQEMINRSIEGFKKGSIHVFRGDYKGTDPNDISRTVNLNKEYIENKNQSAPTFCYIIHGISVEN